MQARNIFSSHIDLFLECNPCQRGMPELLSGARQAWDVWSKVADQYDMAQVDENRNSKQMRVIRRLRFRHESLWNVINATAVDDPMDLFDKVIVIEREFSRARNSQ